MTKDSYKQKQKAKKRKKVSSSEDECTSTINDRSGGPSSGDSQNCDVSDILHETNSVLFDESSNSLSALFEPESVMESSKSNGATKKVTEQFSEQVINEKSPSNADIFAYLKQMDRKIVNIEFKLKTLDSLEEKVSTFDRELKKLWAHVHDEKKAASEKFQSIEERVVDVEFVSSQVDSKLEYLSQENAKLKDSMSYLQSQSMRNNLIFCGIEELPNETQQACEGRIRSFLVDQLKLAQSYVDGLNIERAHRLGPINSGNAASNRCRKIVVKFTHFKDREIVKKERIKLKGTSYYIHEQFPPEIVEKRRRLVLKMKAAQNEGHSAWISYDTLYIDGKAQRDA